MLSCPLCISHGLTLHVLQTLVIAGMLSGVAVLLAFAVSAPAHLNLWYLSYVILSCLADIPTAVSWIVEQQDRWHGVLCLLAHS